MAQVTKSIDVNVPVGTAYNQWTQFEEFTRFMEGVEQVRQLDDTHLAWKAKVGGKTEEWTAEITEQHPDHRVAWKSTSGARNDGVVTFHQLDGGSSRVTVQLEYESEGVIEKAGDLAGMVDRRVQGDLERFKEFIESRGGATGAWRGDVENRADVTGSQDA
ncbi:MAG TPA: SRPBCC family protein [Thermomicrobiales bacterium]|nr:SRPBCC family protein [Thermomicrobiales bacterium]